MKSSLCVRAEIVYDKRLTSAYKNMR